MMLLDDIQRVINLFQIEIFQKFILLSNREHLTLYSKCEIFASWVHQGKKPHFNEILQIFKPFIYVQFILLKTFLFLEHYEL